MGQQGIGRGERLSRGGGRTDGGEKQGRDRAEQLYCGRSAAHGTVLARIIFIRF